MLTEEDESFFQDQVRKIYFYIGASSFTSNKFNIFYTICLKNTIFQNFHNFFLFLTLISFESLKIVSINIVTIMMMPAKMITLGLFKIKAFWNKIYDIIVSVYDVTNKILSDDSNYIVDVLMWPKFGNSSISIKFSWPQFYKDLTRITIFIEEWSWFKFNNLALALGMALKFYTSVAKELN